MEVELARCSGHCCRSFTLPHSPAELREQAELMREWEAVRDDEEARSAWQDAHPGASLIRDIIQIEGMVVYLGPFYANPVEDQVIEGFDHLLHFYTCRNFDGANCRIYDSRPEMCRDYPYGRPCTYAACTRKATSSELEFVAERIGGA